MIGSSSGHVSVGFSSNNSGGSGLCTGACSTNNPSYQVAVPSIKACSTNNPSYQAAVPYSSGYGGSSSLSNSSSKPSSQPTYSHSSNYNGSSSHISNSHKSSSQFDYSSPSKYTAPSISSAKWFTQSSKDAHSSVAKYYGPPNKTLALKKSRSQSSTSHSSNYPNPNFIQLLPVSTQFPDSKMLPKSMKNMSTSDQVVNFYPVQKKGPNYLNYCVGWLSNEEKPSNMRDCIWQYTSGPNWYCTEVNMALASDSPKLSSYGLYIRQLKYSIGMSQMRFVGTVFRG